MSKERRKFERVSLPPNAKAYVTTQDGKRVGNLSVVGRGGFQVDTTEKYKPGEAYSFVIVDESEGISRGVWAIPRMVTPDAVGFEFESLEADAAVEVGVIIGTLAACAFGATKSERVEASAPRIATTCSLEMSRVAAVAASSGLL